MATYTITAKPSGSSKDNDAQRNIAAVFPYDANQYRTISEIVRRDGIWCSCGGTSQSVTMAGYDQLINTATGAVIKTSDTGTCKCHGTGPAAENYMTCTFSNWTQAESNAAVAAWKAGTLLIRRTVSITAYTSSNHGTPTFRDGQYDDTITITGSTLPFTDYRPQITAFSCMRSNDGSTEEQLSTSVYATIKLAMNDSAGLSDSPKLLLEYSTDNQFVLNVVGVYLGTSAVAITPYLSGKTILLSGTFSVGSNYYFRLSFTAGEEAAQISGVSVSMSYTPLHIPQSNAGVALGMYSNASGDDKRFECNYPAYLYGGIRIVDGGVEEQTLAFDADAPFVVRADNPLQPTLRRFGHVIELHGEIQPAQSIDGSTTYHPICTLPYAYAPHHDVTVLQQGSNQSIWMLRIFKRDHLEHPCKVMFARYRSGDAWASAATTAWLPFHATWIV